MKRDQAGTPANHSAPGMLDGAAFFAAHPEFLSSIAVKQEPNRLRRRFDVIFARNRDLFRGARVLDLGSHDGRWSMAALDLGAERVVGLELLENYLVEAKRIFAAAGLDAKKYTFLSGAVPDDIKQFDVGQFDVIMCLGLYYHTANHVRLFEEMHRLQPKHIILDTAVSRWPFNPIVEFRRSHYAPVVGKPNHSFIRMMADVFGWKLNELSWKDGQISDWADLSSYRNRGRRSYVLTRQK